MADGLSQLTLSAALVLRKNKTIKDGGITIDFRLSKSILPIEIPFGSLNTWGSSNSFGSSKFILSFEMTLRPSETWGSLNSDQKNGNRIG